MAVESNLDLHGMFGLGPNARPGMTAMHAMITIAGDADEEALREVALLGYQFSPVRNTISEGVPVTPNVDVAN